MFSLSDIHPLSEFQRGAKAFIARLKETKAPIVLTVNGKAAAVVQDAESYQQLLDRMELLESIAGIRKSIEEFEQGEGIPLKEAFQQLQEKYGRPEITSPI
ncbi:MAG: type II toxin-antitoxin system Phd/YefM family antitoxin [Moorea sp. SIO4G2]|uniref:type II toxin-antitoxin system Phd/YefM family antitoxin n=1 Tax=unclassified Moorena TaxID=2683338 RepID=UPI0013CD5B10|nr:MULTISPECIES: type II toxin-antitoxin system Phd/YefM family antitoxin [unclassified Moorena]NEO51069.1 type II toxin-antitoxin system Phd/YefM family antitoxin [Moorena sp. SIO4A3]NEO63761.1 type II toxin-antitoxin system Phd/YefM family antitoxin [Moorena sp. SIO4G2]NEO17211.1 type II toxin-antitoxin system Phd/YefM family antitoxin [Moorena sp. SIO3E8]NEO24685.1 type II toxin-antitoxin system Phd/YefM family antitoxin [Moorena sp. SIO4A5]NEQ03755.1 type II toxin-antitoxin system Phd/YefM